MVDTATEPIAIEAPKANTLPDGFEPIADPKLYKWQPGMTVRVPGDAIIGYDKKGSFFVGIDYDWVSFKSAFVLNVVKPITFDELNQCTKNAVESFVKGNSLFDDNNGAPKQAIIKRLYERLFARWYEKCAELNLVDLESFRQAKERMEKSNEQPRS